MFVRSLPASRWSRLCALTLTMAGYGYGQEATGSLVGSVTDAAGGMLPHASVVATRIDTGQVEKTETNGSGEYTLAKLQPGVYRVVVDASGFAEQRADALSIEVGDSRVLRFALRAGGGIETVTVSTEATSVDLGEATNQNVVQGRSIVELPLNGRDWAQLATLQPGVALVRSQSIVTVSSQRVNRGVGNELTVNGARPQANNYRVDGFSINDYANSGPGSVQGSNLGVDAIAEFSVVTSTPTAEYGKTAGGVVNAVTRSGTNRVHGSAFEFLRNSALDARSEFDAVGRIAPFRRNQFGGTLGGPLVHDRTFVFGAYEGLRQSQSANAASLVPSLNARNGSLASCQATGSACQFSVDPAIRPYLAFYPLPNGAAQGNGDTAYFNFNQTQKTVEDYFTVRGTQQFRNGDMLSATYFRDHSTLTTPDPLNIKVVGFDDARHMGGLTYMHVLTPQLVNTARLGYTRFAAVAPSDVATVNPAAADTSLGFVPGMPAGLVNVTQLSNMQGGTGALGKYGYRLNSYQAYEDAVWTRGRHVVGFGASFERLQNNELGLIYPNGFFNFSSLENFLRNRPFTFTAQTSPVSPPRDLRQSVWGAYVQDAYRAGDRLTLNFGVRYEPTSVPTETAGRLSTLRSLTDTTPHLGDPYFANPSLGNVAPRVGLSWDPFGSGKTAVRAGYGVYDSLPLNYLFQNLALVTAPYLVQGSVTNLAVGTFPGTAYALLGASANATSTRYSYTAPAPGRSYAQQWNVNVQQELVRGTVMQLGYFASRGTRLPYRLDDANTVQPTVVDGQYSFNLTTPGPKLNPSLGQISALLFTAHSHYDSLQALVTRQMSHHVQAQASFTWSRSFDDSSSGSTGDPYTNSLSSSPLWAPARRRGPSDFDVPRILVLSMVAEMPRLSHAHALTAAIVNGWQWNGIFQATSGLPFTPLISGDALSLKSNDAFDFPDRISTGNCAGNPVNSRNRYNYLRQECFTFPQVTTDVVNGVSSRIAHLGNAGRNSISGPGLASLDASLIKNFGVPTISERFAVQFRAECFNIANRVNYGPPVKASTFVYGATGAPISSPGALTLAATSSRQMQFALKVQF